MTQITDHDQCGSQLRRAPAQCGLLLTAVPCSRSASATLPLLAVLVTAVALDRLRWSVASYLTQTTPRSGAAGLDRAILTQTKPSAT